MKITFLGTGAAEGIPAIGCDCDHCTLAREQGGKLPRERNAILFELPGYNLLVDSPPNTRGLINKYQVTNLHGILATAPFYSHVGGIKEFEYWPAPLDFLAEPNLFKVIHEEHWTEKLRELMFHVPYYAGTALHFGQFNLIPFASRRRSPVFGIAIQANGYKVVYVASTPNQLTNYARCMMEDVDILIISTPTFKPPKDDHITLAEAVVLKDEVGAKQLVLTKINHRNRTHNDLEAYISQFDNVTVAYDSLSLEI